MSNEIFFYIGIGMISYDMLGHFSCLLARLSAKYQKQIWIAKFWNKFSKYIWPSLKDSIVYEFYWSIFFIVAIVFILVGRH